jgi:hypothetical protein
VGVVEVQACLVLLAGAVLAQMRGLLAGYPSEMLYVGQFYPEGLQLGVAQRGRVSVLGAYPIGKATVGGGRVLVTLQLPLREILGSDGGGWANYGEALLVAARPIGCGGDR